MKVGWYSHHIIQDEKTAENRSTGLFSGKFAGGAEMSDFDYKKCAPDQVEIVEIDGGNWQNPQDFDSIVVTGTESFSGQQLLELATRNPFVFVHHLQTPRKELKQLIDKSRLFVTHTPAHMARELRWTNPKNCAQVLSYFDTSQIKSEEKDEFALWAARNHPSKGELNAFNLALKLEIPFVPITNKPRADVLQAMSYAKYFIHVPLDFESECRTVMEAVLSGCKVITNENVGITSVQDWDDPDALRSMVDKAGETFWRLVLA
jgi:hypothetical protein